MKDVSPSLNFYQSSGWNSENPLTSHNDHVDSLLNALFKISLSQTEHAIMQHLPITIRNGYRISKSMFLQCPIVAFQTTYFGQFACNDSGTNSFIEDGTLYFAPRAKDFITSFALKTGLFHELHSRGISIPIEKDTFHPKIWNKTVLEGDAGLGNNQ